MFQGSRTTGSAAPNSPGLLPAGPSCSQLGLLGADQVAQRQGEEWGAGRPAPHGWDVHAAGTCFPVQAGIGRLGAGAAAFSPSDATAGPSLVVRGGEPRARAGDAGSRCGPGRFRVPPGDEAREPQLPSPPAEGPAAAAREGPEARSPCPQLEKAHTERPKIKGG